MKITTEGATTKTRWGWIDWLLVAASAGLCVLAWRLVGDVQRLRDESESDIRTLRDEYARLERERAELHRQLVGVNERLAALEAAPTTSTSLVTPSLAVSPTSDTASEASMADAAGIKPVRSPRRPRSASNTNGTQENSTPTARKPRSRKPTSGTGESAEQNGATPA